MVDIPSVCNCFDVKGVVLNKLVKVDEPVNPLYLSVSITVLDSR